LVYVYVVLLSLIGLCQILIGGTLLWYHLEFNTIAENKFWGPAAIILSLGIVAQILCWFGWSSTTKKRRCYLVLFNVLLIGLVVMQGFTCIWAFKLRSTLIPRSLFFESAIDNSFEDFLKLHFKYEFAHSWNRIQEQWQCCGVDGITDYRRGASAFPWSCCASSEDPHMTGCAQIYQRGCLGVITNTIKKLLVYASLTAFVAATMQCVGLFCSIQLILSLKRNETEDEVDTSSMSFRQKLERETRPLSARPRVHRKLKIEESIPETVQSI